MTDEELIQSLNETSIIGLTVWGESRSEPPEGRQGIVNVIANRVKAKRPGFGLTPRDVCLKPWQFSCWSPTGWIGNYESVLAAARQLSRGETTGPILRACVELAQGIVTLADLTRGATHYITADLLREKPPAWAKGLTPLVRIGQHVFFRAA